MKDNYNNTTANNAVAGLIELRDLYTHSKLTIEGSCASAIYEMSDVMEDVQEALAAKMNDL